MKKTRIFILTQKDPFFVPKIINFLKKRSLNENFVIAGITALSPSRKNKTIIDWLSERLEMYNLRELFLVFTSLFYVWIVKRFGNFNQRKKFSLEDICYPNIPIIETDNINDPRYLSISVMRIHFPIQTIWILN